MKRTIPVILITLSFVGKVFCQLPSCKDSFPTSLLSNNSFEQYSGCNTDLGSYIEGGFIDGYISHGTIVLIK